MTGQQRNVFMMASILVSIVALFMPWYEVGSGFLRIEVSGWDLEGSGTLLIVLILVGLSWVYEVMKYNDSDGPSMWSLIWVGAGIWNTIDLISLWNRPSSIAVTSEEFSVSATQSWGLVLYGIGTIVFLAMALHAALEWWHGRDSPPVHSSRLPVAAKTSTVLPPKSVQPKAIQTQAVSTQSLPRVHYGGSSTPSDLPATSSRKYINPKNQPPEGTIAISDPQSGARAVVDPRNGFNLFSFEVPLENDRIELLWSEPEFGHKPSKPTRSGIPVLFPFAGRISDATYKWQEKSYKIASSGMNDANAIHGYVVNRRWRVIEQGQSRITAVFQGSIDAPETLNEWPSDYSIRMTWVITAKSLTAYVAISNPGEAALPFTFGLHPYFRVPLGGGSLENTIVTVPADTYLELRDLLPSGQQFPVDEARDLRAGRHFHDINLDDVFTDLSSGPLDTVESTIVNRDSGLKLSLEFSAENGHIVVFTPPHREAIAIEPYTSAPDPFRLATMGIDPKLAVLEPKESWHTIYNIRLESS